MRKLFALSVAVAFVSTASAAFLFEVDTDGLDDGTITYNANFSFGGDTTSAGQSAASNAPFMGGGDSIFGGNGSAEMDTYIFMYTPDAEPDNLVLTAGDDLGEGSTASGIVGGGPGLYAMYATWPYTENVTGGDTTYEIVTNGDSRTYVFNQNTHGHAWIPIGLFSYTDGPVTVTQIAGSNTYTSMRAAGLLFERVPEPATLSLLVIGGLIAVRRR